jgi:hypothetical protein
MMGTIHVTGKHHDEYYLGGTDHMYGMYHIVRGQAVHIPLLDNLIGGKT